MGYYKVIQDTLRKQMIICVISETVSCLEHRDLKVFLRIGLQVFNKKVQVAGCIFDVDV